MRIDDEILKRTVVNFAKLKEYGFYQVHHQYCYSKNFMDDNFRADIVVDQEGKLSGTVFDLSLGEEYTNIKIENSAGDFVNRVKEEYRIIIEEIRNHCFERQFFLFPQSNRIAQYIFEKYGDEPEFLWEKSPGYGVFRNKQNHKWYGIIMNIDRSKLENSRGEIEIINVKTDWETIQTVIKEKGFYEGYHLNKKNWLTVSLDDTHSDQEIIAFIDDSYHRVSLKR